MADFRFVKGALSSLWVIVAPRRSKRPDVGHRAQTICPFCVGREQEEPDVYRVGGKVGDSNWHIRVIPNSFAFAPIHELVIHSPDHHKNFDELPFEQVSLIFQTYRVRYLSHMDKGQVYIFHNRGIAAGESLPHPHTQLVVIPHDMSLACPSLQIIVSGEDEKIETNHFLIFCPENSQWPDEVWIAPKMRGESFASITAEALKDLAFCMQRLLQILDLRHGHEFPFNFYIYPGKDWYLRIIPREKTLGGFEVGSGIFVNTQEPSETFAFLAEHFWEPNGEKIMRTQKAEYWKNV
jgi:UDPglucose--hexose-1-phosphate uridylyltransferase